MLLTLQVYTQTSNLRGFVYEKETGEPIIFTNVFFYRTTIGAATDVNGYFVISRIPPGDYTLMVSFMGFDTLRMPVTLKGGEVLTKNLYLTKSALVIEGVHITAEREEA